VPLTSAVKVGGERLYRKARRGETFETPVRPVRVSRFELLEFDQEPQTAALEIDCSSGTYVRQLVADLGEICGCGAYCERLERRAIGGFRLDDAAEERLIPLAEALSFMPERLLSEEEARAVGHGRSVAASDEDADEGTLRLTHGERLVAVAQRRDGVLKPVTVFVDG
jgi:tRNA pseudouridine55 synthase